MPPIQFVSALGAFSGGPNGFRATQDAYRNWTPTPGPPTRYLTLATLFRRRQYLEGIALVAGNWEADNSGYGLFVDEWRVFFRFGLRPIGGGDVEVVEVDFSPFVPRLRKWMCVLVQVVHQNSDTTIYLQVNGETVATAQSTQAGMEYAVPSEDSRFCVGTHEGLEAPFQLDIAGVGVSFVGAAALDAMSDWYDNVRQAGELVSPTAVAMPPFQSLWAATSVPNPCPPGGLWHDEMPAGVSLDNIGYSDIDKRSDTAAVML